jgi:hypothetical protein
MQEKGVDDVPRIYLAPIVLDQISETKYRVTDVPLRLGESYVVFFMDTSCTTPVVDGYVSQFNTIDLYPLTNARGKRVLKVLDELR